ncbi:MAG: hypothetical protein PF442_02775 [Desulfobulbaceae bacterium]|jgi:hypothetical protein|nr:hypothetical protein [Desulfobulbaceae bacterium]
MNKLIDPRTCKNFRSKDLCPNWDQEIMVYLDDRVISDVSLSFGPEMFDKAYEFCANCALFMPLSPFPDQGQTIQ